MKKLFGIYCTDGEARDGSSFTVSALDDMIWMGADGGRPLGISHDYHRFIGWNLITGLYISHEMSYVVGSSYLPDSKEEFDWLCEKRKNFWLNFVNEQLSNYKVPFADELRRFNLFINEANWHYKGLALYGYDGITNKAFPDLASFEDDGLIRLEDLFSMFEYKGQGVFASKKSDLAIILHSYFRRSFSIFNNYNFGFIDKLLEVYKSGNNSVKVKIDPDWIGFAPSYRPCHEYEYWFGPKYSDDIESIQEGVAKYQNEPENKLFNNVEFTEFVWQKKDDGDRYQFEMEEVVDTDAPTLSSGTFACRYLHAFYDFESKEFHHFDGAIRAYDLDGIAERLGIPMNQAGHNATYTKIFRMDGEIGIDLWKGLITQYLCSNHAVYDYFNIPRPFPSVQKAEKIKSVKDYIPYVMKAGDGVRLCISYGPKVGLKENWCFANFDEIELEDGKHDAIEFPTIEVMKVLKKNGCQISLPDDKLIIIVEDYNNNIPTVFHGDGKDVEHRINMTLNAIRCLMDQHVENHDDEIYSLSLSWNLDERNAIISFMGHVNDLSEWLSSFNILPCDRARLKGWIEQQNIFIHQHGKDSDSPISDKHIMSDGVLFLKRRPILKDVSICNIKIDTKIGCTATLELKDDDKELDSMLQNGDLQMTLTMLVKSAIDKNSGGNYIDSTLSAVFKETEYLVNPKILGWVWTDNAKPIYLD